MPGPPFIEGDRIDLRTVEREDIPFLQRWVNHPEVRRYISTFRTPYSQEEYEEEIFDPYDTNEDGATVLLCHHEWDGDDLGGPDDGPTAVGSAQLYPIREGAGWANLAYWVAPPAQGNGYATEAAELLVEYAFDELGLHRVTAQALEPNEASCRVLERVGFTHEGTQRECDIVDGSYVGQRLYGLLREEWNEGT
jgi:RimJ/RimL family protein N-acetyltransferase